LVKNTFKLWQRLTVLFAGKDHIQRKLDIFREWYDVERPMWLHGGRTPEEVWSNAALPETQSFLTRDRVFPHLVIFFIFRAFYGGICVHCALGRHTREAFVTGFALATSRR
jgi:hypothetical protein